MPPLATGTYNLALLPLAASAQPADPQLTAPLLLQPLVALPEDAAGELLELWDAGCQALRPQQPGSDCGGCYADACKSTVWSALMNGLLQDVAAVLAYNSLSATLVTSTPGVTTSDAHQSSSAAVAGSQGPCMAGSDHGGSRSAWQQQPGAGRAGVPLQGKSPMEVQAMVALQDVLAPLLHYLSMHQMWALSRLLCDRIKTAAHHTSATHSAAPAAAYAAGSHPAAAGANGGSALIVAGAATVGDDTDDDSEEDEEVARGAAGPTWLRLLQRSMQEWGVAKLLLGSWAGRAGSGRVGRGSSKGVGGSGLLRQRLRAQATTLPGCGGAVGSPPEASSVGHLPASPPAEKVQLVAAACGGAAPGHPQHLPWRSQLGMCLAPRLLRCAGVFLAMAFCVAGLEVTLRQVGLPPLLGAAHLQWLH